MVENIQSQTQPTPPVQHQNVPQAQPIQPLYVPNSVDKKKALIMYLLVGIIMMIGKSEMNVFEHYHLKQSTGWWILFVVLFVAGGILLFVPFVKMLGIIPLVLMILVWMFFAHQAWSGGYTPAGKKGGSIQLFVGIGGWLLDLFDIHPKVQMPQIDEMRADVLDQSSQIPQTPPPQNTINQ